MLDVAGAIGLGFAFLREVLSRRKRNQLARAVDLGKEAARTVMNIARELHIDTAQLVTRAGQYVREVGRGLGFTDAQMRTALETAEAELGRLYLEDALGNLERELAKHKPAILATVKTP